MIPLLKKIKFYLNNALILLKKKIFLNLINFIAFVLLVFASPILSLIWLSIPTLYFLFTRNYKSIINIWAPILGIWYLIFTFSMSPEFNPIIIGPGYTENLLTYLVNNDLLFEGLCFQTVYILNEISLKLGCLIYIPVFFSLKKTYNMGKEDDKPTTKKNSWFKSQKKPNEAKTDFNQCGDMAEEYQKHWYSFQHKKTELSKDGKRVVTAKTTNVPFFGTYHSCTSRPISREEQDMVKQKTESKKN